MLENVIFTILFFSQTMETAVRGKKDIFIIQKYQSFQNECMGNVFSELFTSTTDKILHYPRAASRWAQETWNSLW